MLDLSKGYYSLSQEKLVAVLAGSSNLSRLHSAFTILWVL